jgi:hypothetical protein
MLLLITLTAAATKKAAIGNTDNRQFTTFFNSASMAVPIGLPPMMAKFCHTSNRLLSSGALMPPCPIAAAFNSSVVSGIC